MATLAIDDLVQLRQECAREFGKDLSATPIDYVKPQINAALQAIEDWFDSPQVQAQLAGVVAAAAPGVFSPLQRDKLVKFWLNNKSGRE